MNQQIYLWLSKRLYFPTARYFRFFAGLVLRRWRPKIIAVIGSAGKSNAHNLIYHLVKQQYSIRRSVKANSAFAIPLDVLDIHLHNYTVREWFLAGLKVPFITFYRLIFPFPEKFYICELDVDRPGEMAFFAKFIKPEIVFWVSAYATHTANFDQLLKKQHHGSVSLVVAQEFAKIFDGRRQTLGLLNADAKDLLRAVKGKKFKRMLIAHRQGFYQFRNWQIFRKRTCFDLWLAKARVKVELPFIAPRNFGYTILAAYLIKQQLNLTDESWLQALAQFQFNPGICSILNGLKNSKLIDSSYNSSLYATKALLEVLDNYPGQRKVAVLGDMRELGAESQNQHRQLAEALLKFRFAQVVLVGPEMKQYVYPLLEPKYDDTSLHHFDNSYQAGLFIKERLLKPHDVVLLKASQNTLFFEIIAQLLLANPDDQSLLCRRAPVWEKKRVQIKENFYKLLQS